MNIRSIEILPGPLRIAIASRAVVDTDKGDERRAKPVAAERNLIVPSSLKFQYSSSVVTYRESHMRPNGRSMVQNPPGKLCVVIDTPLDGATVNRVKVSSLL